MTAVTVLAGDAEALGVAGELAADFRKDAAERTRAPACTRNWSGCPPPGCSG